jgi:hypothetical protein
MMVWSDTSSDDERTSCELHVRRQVEVVLKGKMLENTLNDMVNNDKVEVPYFLPAIEGEDYGTRGG